VIASEPLPRKMANGALVEWRNLESDPNDAYHHPNAWFPSPGRKPPVGKPKIMARR
jgi:hypothetical protein